MGPNRTLSMGWYVGEPFDITYTWERSGSPVDLTGATASLVIRRAPGAGIVDTLTDGSGITLGGAAGTIQITRTADQITGYLFTIAVFELYVTLGTDPPTWVATGNITRYDTEYVH